MISPFGGVLWLFWTLGWHSGLARGDSDPIRFATGILVEPVNVFRAVWQERHL